MPEIPQITIRGIDVEHFKCRLYELDNPETVTFKYKGETELSDCDGTYALDSKDLMQLRGFIYLMREAAK